MEDESEKTGRKLTEDPAGFEGLGGASVMCCRLYFPYSTFFFLLSTLYLHSLSFQFVAQPNCQQLLATLWYDGFPGWRRRHWAVKLVTCFIIGLLFPVFSLVQMGGGCGGSISLGG